MIFKRRKYIWLTLAIVLVLLCGWLVFIGKFRPSLPEKTEIPKVSSVIIDSVSFVSGSSWLHKNNSGLWELYVEGSPLERGARIGVLSKNLIDKQEIAFIDQINQIIPSKFYLSFLKYFIGFFNRGLGNAIPEEYKEEILAVSSFASHSFNYIGTPYQRIMNYHAAHDIGHALQSMGMVGCTSFATWGKHTKDNTLLIGRNFDFYVGDKFAEDKIIAFINPDKGYKHMFVTWGGMIGVVSGMNEKGLTVTLNASNTEIPFHSATPVSIIAREILQYAENIDEAVKIARSRKSFVSEQFLVGSAVDGCAAIIEKSPSKLSVYKSYGDNIISANHFQSPTLAGNEKAIRQRVETASGYRYQRVSELLIKNKLLTPFMVATILRDTKGHNDMNIGLGNEKSINQLIAHHSIIFEPKKKMVWVSTSPYQMGEYVAYNLDSVFYGSKNKCMNTASLPLFNIPADSAFIKELYPGFQKYRQVHSDFSKTGILIINPDSFLKLNPGLYQTYIDIGDYWQAKGDKKKALTFYNLSLKKEIATFKERNIIKKKINDCLKYNTN